MKDVNKLSYSMGRLIVVDDEVELMTALCERLGKLGYETAGFTTGREALEALREWDYDLLLTDLMMPGMDGIELLRAGLAIDPNLIGIIMTGQGTVETARDAMKSGAFDYVLKPFRLNELLPVLSRALEVRSLRLENMQLKETVAMHELGQAIAYSTDLNLILNKAADAALQQCDADEASIMLPTADGRELVVVTARGGHVEHVGKRMPIEQGIAGWVARNRKTLTLQGEVDDPLFTPLRPRSDIRTAVSMPMLAGGNFVGVLNVNILHGRRPFTLGQMKALSMLVSIVSPILDNTRLYIEIRQAEERYRAIFENASDGICQTTPEGQFLIANPAMAAILGYDSPRDLISTVTDIPRQLWVDPRKRKEIVRRFEESGKVENFEVQLFRKDGAIIWASVNLQVIRDSEGNFLHFQGIVQDITQRKRTEEERRANLERTRHALEATVQSMAAVVETRDAYTAGHQRRVADLARLIAKKLGLPNDTVEGIRMAGIIHDIGKVAVPTEILTKPANLSALEFGLIKVHPRAGYDIVQEIDFPWPVADMILQHHERLDGTGYPQGLRGGEILMEAKIIAVADVIEAMSSHRPYRPSLGMEQAVAEISKNRGILYDPSVVDACLSLIDAKDNDVCSILAQMN